MKKSFLVFTASCFFLHLSYSQNTDEKEILGILDKQTLAWNSGNINNFMVGYWESDSLMYIGKSGVTYGYQNTLDNYKKNYSDTVKMGKLAFNILHLKKISADAYFVVGKWFLERSIGDAGGHYTLLFRKIKGRWVIVADHSS
ncbi:MAG: SnoaL-like domain-containing protein [Bacteroidia bacterium]|nr:SnoaL-like domain-containing protein [Bacteroidia bacterium]